VKNPKPIYLYRTPGPTLKISPEGSGFFRLYVEGFGGDYFVDVREAAEAAASKRSGFAEWDETPFSCSADLNDWKRI